MSQWLLKIISRKPVPRRRMGYAWQRKQERKAAILEAIGGCVTLILIFVFFVFLLVAFGEG